MSRLITNSAAKNDYMLSKILNSNINNEVIICSPFFTDNEFLSKVIENDISLRLVIRLDISTDCNLLAKLLEYDNAQVRYYNTREFHSKLYIFDKTMAIVGSSNFTKSGLSDNMELNIEISNQDCSFNELLELAENYWDKSQLLTDEVLSELRIIINEANIDNEKIKDAERKIADLKSRLKDKKNLSDIHKYRISVANRGKKGRKLDQDDLRKLIEANREANSKAVICINTMKKYDSLKNAAIDVYDYERSYGYISDVCKGKKEHYKSYVWRFLNEYNILNTEEKQDLLDLVNNIRIRKHREKTKLKILYGNKRFDTMKEFGDYAVSIGLINETIVRSEQLVSALIDQARKLGNPFVRNKINGMYHYWFFAEYNIITDGDKVIEETPVGKSVKDYKDEYLSIFDLQLGDLTLGDLLCSKTKIFHEIEGFYFKGRKNALDILGFDFEVSKQELLRSLMYKEYIFEEDLDINTIKKSTKKKYYIKDNYVFKTKNGYIDKNIRKVNKNKILSDLGL